MTLTSLKLCKPIHTLSIIIVQKILNKLTSTDKNNVMSPKKYFKNQVTHSLTCNTFDCGSTFGMHVVQGDFALPVPTDLQEIE